MILKKTKIDEFHLENHNSHNDKNLQLIKNQFLKKKNLLEGFIKTNSFNKNQIALLKWIQAGLDIDECINKFGDSGYLFSNMIAKFISSSDEYYISKNALIMLEAKNFDIDKIFKRSFLARLPELFLEHSVPVSLIREKLLSINSNIDDFFLIIKSMGPLVIILRSENKELDNAGLRSKMPINWNWGDDKFARYNKVGIEISDKKLKVSGRLIR